MEDTDTPDVPAQDRTTDTAFSGTSSTQYAWLWVVLITVVGCALRSFRLDARSLSLDEGFSYFLSQVSAAEFFSYLRHGELNMALYYVLLRAWPFTSSEAGLRWLSVVFGTLTVPALYFLGRRLFGVGVALTATVLLAVHPFAVELSQRARSYSLAILLVTLAGFFLVKLVAMPSEQSAAGYVISAAAAVYSHFFAVLALGAQALPVLFSDRRRPRLFVVASVVLLTLLLPCLGFLLFAPRTELAWVAPLSAAQIKSTIYALTLSNGRSLAYLLTWIIAIAALFRAKPGERLPSLFVVSWLFLPIVVTIAASAFRPMLVERFLAVCIPAAVLLAARGVSALSSASRLAAAALLALIVFYSGSSLLSYFRHPDYDEDWRGAIAYILDNAQSEDLVVVDPYTRITFDFYSPRLHAQANTHRWSDDLSSAVSQTPQPENIWVLGRKADAGNVGEFVNQQRVYCESSPSFASYDVVVWHLKSCTNH